MVSATTSVAHSSMPSSSGSQSTASLLEIVLLSKAGDSSLSVLYSVFAYLLDLYPIPVLVITTLFCLYILVITTLFCLYILVEFVSVMERLVCVFEELARAVAGLVWAVLRRVHLIPSGDERLQTPAELSPLHSLGPIPDDIELTAGSTSHSWKRRYSKIHHWFNTLWPFSESTNTTLAKELLDCLRLQTKQSETIISKLDKISTIPQKLEELSTIPQKLEELSTAQQKTLDEVLSQKAGQA